MTSDQKQIIIGTLLGNSKLLKDNDGYYLEMKSRDSIWLESKAHALKDIAYSRWMSHGNYYWRSKSHESFYEFKELCYSEHNKVFKMECLNSLRNIGIMVWYGDVGCLVGRTKQNACVRTQAFCGSESIAHQFFNEIDADCNISYVRQKPILTFTLKGTTTIMKIVYSVLPTNRHHLVPSCFK